MIHCHLLCQDEKILKIGNLFVIIGNHKKGSWNFQLPPEVEIMIG